MKMAAAEVFQFWSHRRQAQLRILSLNLLWPSCCSLSFGYPLNHLIKSLASSAEFENTIPVLPSFTSSLRLNLTKLVNLFKSVFKILTIGSSKPILVVHIRTCRQLSLASRGRWSKYANSHPAQHNLQFNCYCSWIQVNARMLYPRDGDSPQPEAKESQPEHLSSFS